MALPSSSNEIPTGAIGTHTPWGQFNQLNFLVAQAISKINTMAVVEVIKCTNAGGLSPVGYVDVRPLVGQVDGAGREISHVTIYNVPYMRLQGGANAIIIDPEPGDIGPCGFCSRDISRVKKTKKASPPGSMRQHSMADGLYFGGTLNDMPSQYIRFSSAGIEIHSPTKIIATAPVIEATATTSATVNAPTVTVNATTASIIASASAAITAPIVSLGAAGQTLKRLVTDTFKVLFNGHTHHHESGSGETAVPTQQMSDTQLTSTISGG